MNGKTLFMCLISGVFGALVWEMFLRGLSIWIVYPHEKEREQEK
jgi:hypothetical protein